MTVSTHGTHVGLGFGQGRFDRAVLVVVVVVVVVIMYSYVVGGCMPGCMVGGVHVCRR